MFKKIKKYGEGELHYKNKLHLAQAPKLKNLFWETTLRCNAKCKHCGSKAGENTKYDDELTTSEIKNVFEKIAKKYDATQIHLSITGGEPLLREDLFDVMSFAKKIGYEWGMTSNGMLITDEVIEKMKETGMETISISLDGLEKTNDTFRGIPGSFQKILNNVKKLKEANFLKCIQITTTVNKSNFSELEELYSLMQKIKVDSWRILNIEPIGRALENEGLFLEDEQYKELLNFIKNKRKENKLDVTYGCTHFLGMDYEKEVRNKMFYCITGVLLGSILYNGDIFVCPDVERRPELIQGNIRKDDFIEVWENKFEWFRNFEKYRKCEKCKKCEDWKYCLGDSVHSWNFDKNEPKICLNKILNK